MTILEQNDYYPFGQRHPNPAMKTTTNRYRYNSKEQLTEVEVIDYGARLYSAELCRWLQVDPLAEKNHNFTPYHFCHANPIVRVDNNGMTDYTFNKITGEVHQVGMANNELDRVLRTNKQGEIKYKRNGEAKVDIDGIEKGILKEGQNFKTQDQIIEVGAENQPTENGVKNFVLQMSEYLGKEIRGLSYSADGVANVSHMIIGHYSGNTYNTSKGTTLLRTLFSIDNSTNYSFVMNMFHTHPDGKLGLTYTNPQLSKDVEELNRRKGGFPNANFFIIYRNDGKIDIYDYTHEYRP
ncbi:MAG: hypothetical protein MJ069_04320 [Salinivirgaceae bacterium]|nr:hypothetical protein [Salinivirgaceae bacterium]